MRSTRREFLKLISALVTTAGAQTIFGENALSENSIIGAANVLPWSGDDFTLGHRLGDGNIPKLPDKPHKKVDFVIVGGGMSGLLAAYFLKESNFLLLEQYNHMGGTSSGSTYRGIDYSHGAVCINKPDESMAQLFQNLQITPAIISNDHDAWHCDGRWYKTFTGDDNFHRQFSKLLADSNSAFAGDTGKLEKDTFLSYLSGFDRPFVGLIDNICNSFYGYGAGYISAAAGYFVPKILTEDNYVFDGGNSGISRALNKAISETGSNSERMQHGAFVWKVQPSDGGASVYYSQGDGDVQRVDCKHVVVCVPPLVALRIIDGIPKAVDTAWRSVEYSPFAVLNFCMKKRVLDYPYQSFADEPYPFCQMVMAESPYMISGRYKPDMGSVLTVYHPFKGGALGRDRLLSLNREEFASSLVSQVSTLMEPFQNNLECIDVTRWGHAICVPKPGLANAIDEVNHHSLAWMSYAHSTAGGGQAFGGAYTAARRAADRCLKGRFGS